MSWDKNMLVSVASGAGTVDSAAFTVPLHATDDVTFPEMVREYMSPEEAAADGYVGTDAYAAVETHFGQDLHAPSIKLGKIATAAVAQIIDWLIAGTPVEGDVAEITVNGVLCTYTAGVTPTADSIAAGLRAAAIIALADEDVTVSGATAHIILTSDNAGQGFSYSEDYTLVGVSTGTITPTVTAANEGIYDDLVAMHAEDPNWFGLTLGITGTAATDKINIKECARFAQAYGKLFLGQSSDADVLTKTAGNIAAYLDARSYSHVAYYWHHDNDELIAVATMAYRFEADPDIKTTGWAYCPLTGVAVKDPVLTTTEESNLEDQNANYLTTLGGRTCSGMGILSSGEPIYLCTTMEWYAARLREGLQQVFLDVSARNDKIDYDDKYLQVLPNACQATNTWGERTRHFRAGSTVATIPKVADIPAALRAVFKVPVTCSGISSGAAVRVTVTAYVQMP